MSSLYILLINVIVNNLILYFTGISKLNSQRNINRIKVSAKLRSETHNDLQYLIIVHNNKSSRSDSLDQCFDFR